ncbi:DUF221-domain-containing protein [Amylocystis lapponica]|nr:DUF221-domain-containing protein [Amylocystis lapponica]
MATIQDRPFSKDYSGLINQSVIAGIILLVTTTWHETMKRKRRGLRRGEGLGSVESWQFGYLYQGRSWSKRPSPPHPRGWPFSWVKQALAFPEEQLNSLRGVDATLYTRFLRGCFWFALVHTFTTLPILLPIHVHFSNESISPTSMVRASITSLVNTVTGESLLWIHLVLLIWVTSTWISTLIWIIRGAFRLRAQTIVAAMDRVSSNSPQESQFPSPHTRSPFHPPPPMDTETSTRGLRLRTVMVTNVPQPLRSEKDLREYFEYYLSRQVARPAMGITPTTQPGFLNKSFAFLFNRARGLPRFQRGREMSQSTEFVISDRATSMEGKPVPVPVIDRVVMVRKMTELASLLERREEVLRLLETAHIRLATRTLAAVKKAMDQQSNSSTIRTAVAKLSLGNFPGRITEDQGPTSAECTAQSEEGETEGEDRMQLLIRTLSPFLPKDEKASIRHPGLALKWFLWSRECSDVEMSPASTAPIPSDFDSGGQSGTVWDALLTLPRSTLDPYQPLIHLKALFRGKTVPAIDYYTAKLELLTSLITEKRAQAVGDYEAMSTAFVTFADPADARRACKFLAVHPANPLQCFVTMAPPYEDLDWTRLMKSTFRVEFVKDWVVNLGVWAFTIFWIFPVTLLVTLVSIQNISAYWPALARYLGQHAWEEELLQSFIPTLLVSLLTLLIPLLLFLIAKKAHTLGTLSALHDKIMTRYYKFLIVNVLVFFCVGTAAVQSILVSFSATSGLRVIQIVATSFPTAGPFYVGWLIFITAMHGGVELALCNSVVTSRVLTTQQLPLLVYPATKRQVTPRKRTLGIRPRTFNYYYWLPNHILVIHVILMFAVLNPLVIPFGLVYFGVQATVIKNQLLHVYAKNYEANGQIILIRLIRYSLDGTILSQAVFLAYMVVVKKTVNVAVTAVLIGLTAFVKMWLTRMCRARFEHDNSLEASIICGTGIATEGLLDEASPNVEPSQVEAGNSTTNGIGDPRTFPTNRWSWKLPVKLDFAYATIPTRPHQAARRQPNPFGPSQSLQSKEPLQQSSSTTSTTDIVVSPRPTHMTSLGESDEYPETSAQTQRLTESPELLRPALVTRHPPHPAWDDESSPDRTYDNPFYTREIYDVLWLPRDPLALLDLDDTVESCLALTSQPGVGRLGAWRDNEFAGITSAISLSSLPMSVDSFDHVDNASFANTIMTRHKLTGTEEIALPHDIAARVEGLKKGDAEVTVNPVRPRRPSQFSGRMSSHSSAGPSSAEVGHGLRRPTFATDSSGFRSFSLGADIPTRPQAEYRPSSLSNVSVARTRDRSVSMDHALEVSSRPHSRMHSARFAHSVLSIVEPLTAPSFVSTVQSPRMGSIISTRDAVVGEVIVEEEYAMQDRLRAEAEEAERAQAPRSLLTRWMFARWQ